MEANTSATPSFPGDNPIVENPIQDNETKVNETRDDPTWDDPTKKIVSTPARPKGPNVAAVVLGLAAIVLAGLIIANETMGLRVDWSRLGPGGIVGIGLVLVVLGAIGLVRRHDDV
jgi:hypothetical protein